MIDPEASLFSVDEIAAFRQLLERQLAESHDAVQADDTGKGRCWPHYALMAKLFSEYLKKVLPLNNRRYIS